MKAYRWMSFSEFTKLYSGCTIRPYITVRTERTSGSGVFFLPENYGESIIGGDPYYYCEEDPTALEKAYSSMDPERSLWFLNGIVSRDVMVEFEINQPMTEAYGCYADPIIQEWDARVTIKELCCPEYNMDTMIPLRYYIPKSEYDWKGDWFTW